MIRIRRAEERGHFDFGWLDTYHTFSFGDYYDPENMGFRSLRVINEDWVRGGGGFPPHPHRDMEIVTYVLEGALDHSDSMGNGSTIKPGEAQRMTAGTGVVHSEQNGSKIEPVHLLQIWILPERRGLEPSYEQKPIRDEKGRFAIVASPDGRDGSVRINQDASILAAHMDKGQTTEYSMRPGRHAWVQVVRGPVTVNGEQLERGDGAALSDESGLRIEAIEPAHVLVFDLA
jgi:quercetin 2,3-dioxygenase